VPRRPLFFLPCLPFPEPAGCVLFLPLHGLTFPSGPILSKADKKRPLRRLRFLRGGFFFFLGGWSFSPVRSWSPPLFPSPMRDGFSSLHFRRLPARLERGRSFFFLFQTVGPPPLPGLGRAFYWRLKSFFAKLSPNPAVFFSRSQPQTCNASCYTLPSVMSRRSAPSTWDVSSVLRSPLQSPFSSGFWLFFFFLGWFFPPPFF